MRAGLLAAALLCLPGAAIAAGLDQLKAFLGGARSGKAEFLQTVVAKSGRKPQVAAGTMSFSRPGKFRWVYERPYHQLIVGDGDRLWVYDRELNQVTVKKLSAALGASPAALLAGDNALERDFALKDGGEVDGIAWVEAQPRSAEATFEHLRIGFSGSVLRAMELTDTFGQTTKILFDRFERNPAFPAGTFRFVPPAGADVVGE